MLRSVNGAGLCTSFTTSHLVLQWEIFSLQSSPICSSPLPLLSLFFHYIKTPEKSAKPWVVFMLELDRNWTLSLNSCLIFLSFHCFFGTTNNFPLAGTRCCLCVLWVMCCNPKLSSLTKKGIWTWIFNAGPVRPVSKKKVLIFLEKISRWTEK